MSWLIALPCSAPGLPILSSPRFTITSDWNLKDILFRLSAYCSRCGGQRSFTSFVDRSCSFGYFRELGRFCLWVQNIYSQAKNQMLPPNLSIKTTMLVYFSICIINMSNSKINSTSGFRSDYGALLADVQSSLSKKIEIIPWSNPVSLWLPDLIVHESTEARYTCPKELWDRQKGEVENLWRISRSERQRRKWEEQNSLGLVRKETQRRVGRDTTRNNGGGLWARCTVNYGRRGSWLWDRGGPLPEGEMGQNTGENSKRMLQNEWRKE